MIGEKIDRTKLNEAAANDLLSVFTALRTTPKLVLAIAGESGSGKTHMAIALEASFGSSGIKTEVLHMDDFFKLPPKLNHQNRLQDFNSVGPAEVDLERLNQILSSFKNNASIINAPLVDYNKDQIEDHEVNLKDVQVLIVEGTYSFYLNAIDFHLFMSRNYKETLELRSKRNRGNEVNDPFIERVLEREHDLITATRVKADAWIDFHFNLKYHVE